MQTSTRPASGRIVASAIWAGLLSAFEVVVDGEDEAVVGVAVPVLALCDALVVDAPEVAASMLDPELVLVPEQMTFRDVSDVFCLMQTPTAGARCSFVVQTESWYSQTLSCG